MMIFRCIGSTIWVTFYSIRNRGSVKMEQSFRGNVWMLKGVQKKQNFIIRLGEAAFLSSGITIKITDIFEEMIYVSSLQSYSSRQD
jgi:hypothetical protein